MSLPPTWLDSSYALLHGDDGDGRSLAMEAWKAVHVDPEWADFSLLVCVENCPWAEVQNALYESAPMGVNRVVVVPQADNLLDKPKELPETIQAFLSCPLPDTRLLLVCRTSLSAAPGRILGHKIFKEWASQGRILKTGALDPREAAAFIESEGRSMGLRLEGGVAALLAARMGGNPGILRRTLEVLELQSEGGTLNAAMVDQATFRLGEQNAFAWSQAWQKGQLGQALLALRQALEEDPVSAPLMLLGQARREVERLVRLMEARKAGIVSPQELLSRLSLTPKQAFLLDGYRRVADGIGRDGVSRLLRLINQTDLDIKGMALGSQTALLALTVSCARAWGGR